MDSLATYKKKEYNPNKRFQLVYDTDHYYHLDRRYPEDLEIMEQLESEEMTAYACIEETYCEHCEQWKVTESIHGCIYDSSLSTDEVLKDIVSAYFVIFV